MKKKILRAETSQWRLLFVTLFFRFRGIFSGTILNDDKMIKWNSKCSVMIEQLLLGSYDPVSVPHSLFTLTNIYFEMLFYYPPSSGISSCARTVYTVMCFHTWLNPAIHFRVGSGSVLISRHVLRAINWPPTHFKCVGGTLSLLYSD